MLRKLNTSDLTAQQQAAVQSLLQSYRGGNAEQRQRLLSDADFLLDCLYSRNPDTRQRAATGLAKLAGRPIEIDAKREPTDLADAIETLRDELVVGKALQKGR